jgi:hypothetical protein
LAFKFEFVIFHWYCKDVAAWYFNCATLFQGFSEIIDYPLANFSHGFRGCWQPSGHRFLRGFWHVFAHSTYLSKGFPKPSDLLPEDIDYPLKQLAEEIG